MVRALPFSPAGFAGIILFFTAAIFIAGYCFLLVLKDLRAIEERKRLENDREAATAPGVDETDNWGGEEIASVEASLQSVEDDDTEEEDNSLIRVIAPPLLVSRVVIAAGGGDDEENVSSSHHNNNDGPPLTTAVPVVEDDYDDANNKSLPQMSQYSNATTIVPVYNMDGTTPDANDGIARQTHCFGN